MSKRRILPERLVRLVTFQRRRELKPREIAQYAVNIARRYPDYHEQSIDADCANRACLVGWCESLMAKEMPRALAQMSHRRRVKVLGGQFDPYAQEFQDVRLVADRLGLGYRVLRDNVYAIDDEEEAIANFCALTGAKDPGKRG